MVGEAAALGTAVCWTVTALSFEAAGKRIGSLPLNLLRLVIALVLLGGYGWLVHGRVFPTDAGKSAWLWLSLSGLVGFTLGDLCLFRAFIVIGSRLSMLLMALAPPLTALLSWIWLGEWLTAADWLGMLITLGGVVWALAERQSDQMTPHPSAGSGARLEGVLLAVAGALGQASGLVLSKIGMGSYDPVGATQIRVIAGAAGFAALFTVVGKWPVTVAALSDRTAMKWTAIGAFFGPFIGVSLSLFAVQATQAGVAATLMSLTPVLIVPAGALIHRHPMSPRALAAASVAVAGSALLFL